LIAAVFASQQKTSLSKNIVHLAWWSAFKIYQRPSIIFNQNKVHFWESEDENTYWPLVFLDFCKLFLSPLLNSGLLILLWFDLFNINWCNYNRLIYRQWQKISEKAECKSKNKKHFRLLPTPKYLVIVQNLKFLFIKLKLRLFLTSRIKNLILKNQYTWILLWKTKKNFNLLA
jgi:hypothetical protein